MSRAGDTSLVVALPEGRTGASPALFPSAMPRVTRWLTFGAAPGGRAGVSAISPAPATSAHGGGQGDASLLERQYNDETNARTHLLRAVMVTVICVAYIVDNITAVHEATLTPIRVVGASAQALCAAALYARPRHGSALFSLAILCLSGTFNAELFVRFSDGVRSDGIMIGLGAALFCAILAAQQFPHFLAVAGVHTAVTTASLWQGPDRSIVAGRVIAFIGVAAITAAGAYGSERLRREAWLATRLAAASRAEAITAAAAGGAAEAAARVSREELSRGERSITYICHELRNPLHVVCGNLEQLRSGGPALDAAARALCMESLQTAVDMMLRVTNDLLDLAALRQGALRLAPAPTCVRALLSECAALAGARAAVEDAVPQDILVDAARLRQILVNGLTNASKYATPLSGEPAVLAAAIDAATGDLVVTVTDSGPGLHGQTMAQLVQDFGGSGRGGVSGGARSSGMGIPICSRLAGLMGGSLLVEDRATRGPVGGAHGTVFTLRLPLIASPPRGVRLSAAGATVPATTSSSSLAGAHVLVVDDVPSNRRLALFMLRSLGCDAGEADDGDAVLPALRAAAAAGAPYHAVLMDVMMERVDGDAALVGLRAAGEALPVIACTGNATAADLARYARLGFAGALPKPFNREALGAALARVLVVGARA